MYTWVYMHVDEDTSRMLFRAPTDRRTRTGRLHRHNYTRTGDTGDTGTEQTLSQSTVICKHKQKGTHKTRHDGANVNKK